eukprot:2817555-Rhodomonas_salina.2
MDYGPTERVAGEECWCSIGDMPLELTRERGIVQEENLKNDILQELAGDSSQGSEASAAGTLAAPQEGDSGRLERLRLRSEAFMIDQSQVEQEDDPDVVGQGGQASVEMAKYQGKEVVVKWYLVERKDVAKEVQALTEAVLMLLMSLLTPPRDLVVQCYGVTK